MHLLFSLLITTMALGVQSMKMTPEIESCVAQAEERVSSDSEARVKSAVEQVMSNLKIVYSSNLSGLQQALRSNTPADRHTAIDKYMVDTCGQFKSCLMCPLDLA